MKKIIFTADIHGNLDQYQKLIKYCKKIKPYSVIIGGDIAPKGKSEDYINNQRRFLEGLGDLLSPLKFYKIFLMMGNDDCKCNMDVLEQLENKGYFSIINEKRFSLDETFDIAGYAYVPITPFGIKDWEKFDLTNIPQNFRDEYLDRLSRYCRFEGLKTNKGNWENFRFVQGLEKKDSIELDLQKELFTKKPKDTVYVFHTPPYMTNLDRISNKNIGSIALRIFIEKYQPYLTLHGHIHETVDNSGDFRHKIGKTLSMSSGNHNIGNLFLLEFDLHNPQDAKRIMI